MRSLDQTTELALLKCLSGKVLREKRGGIKGWLRLKSIMIMYVLIVSCLVKFQALPQSVINQAQAEEVDRIVALVNDSVITLSELEELTVPMMMRLQTIADPVKRSEILAEQTQAALEQLIGQELLGQTANEQGVTVSDAQVEAQLSGILNQQGGVK